MDVEIITIVTVSTIRIVEFQFVEDLSQRNDYSNETLMHANCQPHQKT